MERGDDTQAVALEQIMVMRKAGHWVQGDASASLMEEEEGDRSSLRVEICICFVHC